MGNTETLTLEDYNNLTVDVNGKADKDLSNVPTSKGILVESYVNGTSWCRIYSDGWCEQGGSTTSSVTTLVFLKRFTDINYNFLGTYNSTGNMYERSIIIYSKSSESITLHVGYYGTANKEGTDFGFDWRASGYIN